MTSMLHASYEDLCVGILGWGTRVGRATVSILPTLGAKDGPKVGHPRYREVGHRIAGFAESIGGDAERLEAGLCQ